MSKLGAAYSENGECEFTVWAPFCDAGVKLRRDGKSDVSMDGDSNGYYRLELHHVAPGTRYSYVLGEETVRPDPASRFQPEGVHGPSEVIDPSFPWTDDGWVNPALSGYVFYELHAGTFSQEGTFDAIVSRLGHLKDLGVTAIELMPVAQFPGSRNWGYDGVFPFAVQNSYGGPRALKRLINAAHREGLAVVLDVVYNHLGPEGNYLRDFGPYFTDRYKTPWGDALNFDGPDSDHVRRFFIENALYWTQDFHVDALRLDAIHAIVDCSARPFVAELTDAVHKGLRAYVIAESDLNDIRVVQPAGFGCDSLWSDNFHHALHVLITGERDGYYQDFGSIADLARAYSRGFVYSGQYSPFRRRHFGNSAEGTPGERFVVCAQNHDQVGNRAQGDRLSTLVDVESLKLAAGAVLLSPYLPLLFMGEEYGETAPFLYFTSHGDPALIEAVRRGRREEFAAFSWRGEVPDPQSEPSFIRSRLTPDGAQTESQRHLREFYRELLRLRREIPALSNLSMERCVATPIGGEHMLVRRWLGANEVIAMFNFGKSAGELAATLPEGKWLKLLDSAGCNAPEVLNTSGSECQITLMPRSFVLYEIVI